MGKGKKLLAVGAVAIGAFAVEQIIHGYHDVMGRYSDFNSILGKIGNKSSTDALSDYHKFLEEKRVWIRQQNTEYVSITSDRGDRLQGYLTYPEEESKVFVLGLHGYHANHDYDPAAFTQYYVEGRGYNFLNVDHVASGDSEGRYVGFDFFESQDSLKWLDYLIDRFGDDIRIIIHGVSMGGATVCKMVDSVPPQVKLAIADCPFTNALEEFDNTAKNFGLKNPEPLLKVFNAMNKVFAGYDLNDTDNRESVKNSKVPMLFVHGDADDFVPTRMGEELYELCGNEKELLIVPGAEHAQSISTDEALYHKTLDAFIDKYLGE